MAAPIRVAILSFAHYHANFMQSFPKRFDPVNHELRRMIRQGELGRIILARIRHGHFHGLEPDFTAQWYMDPALGGGGALLEAISQGAPPPVTLEDGQRALAMILAAYRSVQTGQTQPIC